MKEDARFFSSEDRSNLIHTDAQSLSFTKGMIEKQLQERRESFMLETLAKIVDENPEATFCYYMEFQRGHEYVFHFLGCENGFWKLPYGVTAPVTVQQVDLVGYKKLVESGVIKNNTLT